ncbi:MAG: hypothetical protein HYT83_03025 [Candidatus Levybacteria bacterium]|nr:hypothetical protein [Candidatus Levybacteria bacterium]
MWWIILLVIAGLFIFFRLFVGFFGNWRLTLIRLADSYIYGIEQEKLSEKKAFLKALQLRYQLPRTGELVDELEKQGLSEEEIQKKTTELLRSNSLRQDAEYRYEYVLKRKDFIKEAVDLSSSRSLAEGGMWAGQKIENEMEDMYGLLRDTRNFIKDNDYSLLELLVCVIMIEYGHEIKKKNRDEVAKMIENYFSNRVYYQKYLKK